MSLDEVTRDQLPGVIAQLKDALYYHQQWHGALIRTLVCKLPGDKHDSEPLAHTQCRFGQWYYGKASEQLHTHPGFLAMGEEHQRMHRLAGQLLIAAEAGSPIAVHDFDNFANSLERLRLEITTLERELEDALFNHDSLTGALVRAGILPTLREQQELVKRHVQFSYIGMMDLDHFKAVNDLHGHQAGDRVLAATVHHLIKHLRPYDKVFRYGGEEFLISMPYADLTPCHDRVNELREEISALAIDIDEKEPIYISASFGLAHLDPDIPVEASIDRADKALYAAKSEGRNCVRIWDSSMEKPR